MKREYLMPAMRVVKLQSASILAESLKHIGGNGDLNDTPQPGNGTGSSKPRAHSFDFWDEDETE